jgi:hypothetical protein
MAGFVSFATKRHKKLKIRRTYLSYLWALCGKKDLVHNRCAIINLSESCNVDTDERSLVRNFEMTCYYVAPILPAQTPAQFSAEQAELKSGILLGFLKTFLLGA